ncbi:MAG: hypothetical protein PHE89_00865 [Alphaproteobacteria bacterium]|nr:hypothetical protein [Alphaproteobacteria bacterium]
MKEKRYLCELNKKNEPVLWQQRVIRGKEMTSTIITKPIGEKALAIFVKNHDGLVIIQKGYCVIETTLMNDKIFSVTINKIVEIEGELLKTKEINRFERGVWDVEPLPFFLSALRAGERNARGNNIMEYFEVTKEIHFYRTGRQG